MRNLSFVLCLTFAIVLSVSAIPPLKVSINDDSAAGVGAGAIYEPDPYKAQFAALKLGTRVLDFINDNVVTVQKALAIPTRAIKGVFGPIIDKLRGLDGRPKEEKIQFFSSDQLIRLMDSNNCPGIYYQASPKAPWTVMNPALLIDALDTDLEGVVARACLPIEDQKKFLFGEYKFTRHFQNGSILLSPQVINNDLVPLMSKVSKQGALAWRKVELTGACKNDVEPCYEFSRKIVLAELKARFPWAALYVEDKCNWVFNTAGMGMAHLCYVYGSVTENIVFWGSPIGNQGFSGSYDAKVWDHMLYGIMETFEAGRMNRLIQYAGQFHLLNRFSGNYYRINRDCYMLDYVQGNVIQTINFALITPTEYITKDYRAAVKSVCQYGTLVVKNMDVQNYLPSGLGSLSDAWKKVLGTKAEGMDSTICELNAGLDLDARTNMEGSPITDEEVGNFTTPKSICVLADSLFNALMLEMNKAVPFRGDPKAIQKYKSYLQRGKDVLVALDKLWKDPLHISANCPPFTNEQQASLARARDEISRILG